MTNDIAWAPVETLALERALNLATHLVASAQAQAWQLAAQFDLQDGIELPPVMVSVAAQAGLRVAGPLYLAAQLEFAMLLPAAEALAGLAGSGGLGDEVHAAETVLHQFWEGRHNRFTQPEREALFMRWFGEQFQHALHLLGDTGNTLGAALATALSEPNTSANATFEVLMVDLCEALFKFEPDALPSHTYGLALRTRQLDYTAEQVVRLAGRRLAENLTERGGGLALFAAQELIEAIKQALALLKALSEQSLFGGNSIWELVRIVAVRYLNQSPQQAGAIGARVTRAKTGEIVLAWLAEAYPQLAQDSVDPILASSHPVLRAARAWLEATLSLRQAEPV